MSGSPLGLGDMSYKPWVVVQSASGSPLALEPAAALHRPWGSDHEPEHPLSEVLPDVSSQRQACGSLFPLCLQGPLPAQIPRPRSPELDQGPRLLLELRGPLGAGSPGLSDQGWPRVRVSDSRTEGSSEGLDLALPAALAWPGRTSLGLSILHVTCVDLSLLSTTPCSDLAGVRAWHAGQMVLRCLAPRPAAFPTPAGPPPPTPTLGPAQPCLLPGRTAEGL